jgi:hypothetical protein
MSKKNLCHIFSSNEHKFYLKIAHFLLLFWAVAILPSPPPSVWWQGNWIRASGMVLDAAERGVFGDTSRICEVGTVNLPASSYPYLQLSLLLRSPELTGSRHTDTGFCSDVLNGGGLWQGWRFSSLLVITVSATLLLLCAQQLLRPHCAMFLGSSVSCCWVPGNFPW